MAYFERPPSVGAAAVAAAILFAWAIGVACPLASNNDVEIITKSPQGFNIRDGNCDGLRRLLLSILTKGDDVANYVQAPRSGKYVDICKETSEPLRFDPVIKGRHASLSTDRMTATRNSVNNPYSGVVTQRPLCDDEMLIIRIDKTINTSTDYGIPFGLTLLPPHREITDKLILHRDGTWSLYSRHAQEKGYASTVRDNRRVFEKYPVDLRNLPAGTTLGVKRSSDGTVRFYMNGIDKGIAFSRVPKGLHGFVDVANYVTQVSIINQ